MDIYEATQSMLQTAVGEKVNVSSFVLTYDEKLNQFLLPDFPAVTYNYSMMTPVVFQGGATNLFRVALDVEIWGDLGQIDTNSRAVFSGINAKRVTVGNFVFTIVMTESRDVAELGLDFKRRIMRFSGIAEEVADGTGL